MTKYLAMMKFLNLFESLPTLVIMFFAEAYKNQGEYEWKLMLLPITILIITFSKYLMKATKK